MNILGKLIPVWWLLLASFLAGVTGGGTVMRVWYKGDIAGLELDAANSARDAATTLANETQKVRERETSIADLNLKLEAQSGKEKSEIAAADGRVGDALSRVRRAEAAARSCGTNGAGGGAPGSSGPTAGSWDRLSDALDDDHRECARAANTLASYSRGCHTFAIENCQSK